MQFAIINPSDPYTMTAPDLEVAAVAVCLIGDGKYALEGLENDAGQDVPIFIFGGHNEWFQEKFGKNFETALNDAVETRGADLAKTLESVTLQREDRSSLNDIGGRAQSIADSIRTNLKRSGAA